MNEAVLKRIGVKIGHYTDLDNATGTTVFIAETGADIGIDVRGSSTATFNLESYSSVTSARALAHAVVLTGGSVYGLGSCVGALEYLEDQGVGVLFGKKVVPGVTGAAVYDLGQGNPIKPGKDEGAAACMKASYRELSQGSVGVGTGATVGKWFGGKKMKGGFGMAETWVGSQIVMCAFVVTNALGDVINHKARSLFSKNILSKTSLLNAKFFVEGNTTLAVLATNVALERPALTKIAQMAHDGMARSVFPVHTSLDGDIIFALSSHSGEREVANAPISYLTDLLGLAAGESLGRAIKNSLVG